VIIPSLRSIRKILGILKSSLSANQIALSFALGIFAGLPPMGLHVVIPITLALLVRCSFRAFLLAMGLFKLLSLAVAPASYAIGRFLLDTSRGLDGLWRWLFHLPVLAPMGYQRYLLFGSVVMALCMAVPVFVIVRLLVIKYRRSFTRWVSNWRISKTLRDKPAMKLFRWLAAGGEAKYERGRKPRGLFRFVRKEMLVGLPVVYAVCYLLAAVIVPFFSGRIATSAASFVIGGEVAVEKSAFSLFTGGLTLTGLSVQDPNRPVENVLEIPSLTLDAGMLSLLSKRVVFNAVRIDEAYLHVEREPDGTLNVDNFTSGWNAEAYLEWAAEHADKVDWLGLLRRFLEYLAQPRPRQPKTEDLSRYRGGRSLTGFLPSFVVERIEVGRIHVTLKDSTKATVGGLPPLTVIELELSNLAVPADLNREPVGVSLTGQLGDDPSSGFRLAATFDHQKEVPEHRYELELTKVDLSQLASMYETTLPLEILSGTVTLTARLTLLGEDVLGEVSLLLEAFRCAERTGQPLFGLTPELSRRSVEGLNRYAESLPVVIGFLVDGNSSSSQIHWERPLLETARQGLLMEGRRELQEAIDQLGFRIDVLETADEYSLSNGYAQLQERAEEAARTLIEGGVEELAPPELSDPLKTLLEQLFRSQQGKEED